MPGRPCKVCANSTWRRRTDELIAARVSEPRAESILKAEFGPGAPGRMSIYRHRKGCVEAPLKALTEAANRGADAKRERNEIIEKAEAGELDPSHYLSLATIVGDLRRTGERLERVAEAAETGGQHIAVAGLSGQQTRLAEVRSRLGGHGGYAPQKGQVGGEAPTFNLTINLPGHTETIVATPVVEHDAEPRGQIRAANAFLLPPE